MSRRRRAFTVLLLSTVLAFTACSLGGSAPTTTIPATTTTASPVTTTTAAPEDPTTTVVATTRPTSTTTAAPQRSLLVWTDETRAPIVEAAAVEFEAATGVPVEIEVVSFGDIRQDMTENARLGVGADVFVGRHDWVAELAVDGVIEPIDLSGRADEFFPVALDAFSFRGNLYGLPFDMEAIGLIRNTYLVPDAPATFEELLSVCDTLADTVEQCLALPTGDGYHHYPFLATTGGYIFGYDAVTGYDVALGFIGPFYTFEKRIVSACIEARVPYVSIMDDYDAYLDVIQLDAKAREAGITVICGLGNSPGITNLLAKKGYQSMDEPEKINIQWAGGSDEEVGAADVGGPAPLRPGLIAEGRDHQRSRIKYGAADLPLVGLEEGCGHAGQSGLPGS